MMSQLDRITVECDRCGKPHAAHLGVPQDGCLVFLWPATHTRCAGCQRHTLTASMPHGRCAACDAMFEAGKAAGTATERARIVALARAMAADWGDDHSQARDALLELASQLERLPP